MAFHDNPIVDRNSERSEESVLYVKTILTRKAGFISRDEFPDYGVDLNVELVSDRGATSNIFAIQIKSAIETTIIQHDGVKYISIEFLTSRLGHLCRRSPGYGIITIYDEASKVTYFDYVEDIVNRLAAHRDNDDWKMLEKVNIRLPLNILNPESASQVHRKMTNRFSDHNKMLRAQGGLYGIPSFSANVSDETDFNDLKQVEELLKKHGMGLFNDKNYDMIMSLLDKLPKATVNNSKELVLLAVVTYGQVSMIIDCGYYLQQIQKFTDQLTNEEKFLVDYTNLTLSFKKGNIDNEKFAQGLNVLKQSSGNANSINILTIEINLIYSRFIDNRGKIENDVLNTIQEVFNKIQHSDLASTDKLLLKLFNLENFHNYGTQLFLKEAGRFQLQEKMGINVPIQDRAKRVRSFLDILDSAANQVEEILKDKVAMQSKVVSAFACYYKARFFFMVRFNSMMLRTDEDTVDNSKWTTLYQNVLTFCYQSVRFFSELAMWHDTHQALCCAYDLQVLHRLLFNSEVGQLSLDQIEKDIRKLESTTAIRRFDSNVEFIFNDLRSKTQKDSNTWSKIPEDDIEDHAQIMLEAYEIPQERLVNIIYDINVLNKFHRECTNPDLVLLQDLRHTKSKQTIYASPPVYCIQSTKSGIQSRWSSNIDQLLEQFGTLLKVNS